MSKNLDEMSDGAVVYFIKQNIKETLDAEWILDSFRIHLIQIEILKEKINIEITTGRPGILIGRKGALINKVKSNIQDHFEKEIKINIKEYDVWR
jgi:ribosomal protein S3